ncbi:MAG TPA: hypothetical protein VHJ19_13205 [Gammaproteobacteria bacterium]|nr:hypothetical protein [Gammaproteobacteria bacterium]
MRILVVDDNAAVAEVINMLLALLAYWTLSCREWMAANWPCGCAKA